MKNNLETKSHWLSLTDSDTFGLGFILNWEVLIIFLVKSWEKINL